METANIKTALDEQGLKNNQESSFIRLWKWQLLRLNQSSLKPKAPIAIGVKLRSQFETERADREGLRRNDPRSTKILLRSPKLPRN
jgi:hypothetical protein